MRHMPGIEYVRIANQRGFVLHQQGMGIVVERGGRPVSKTGANAEIGPWTALHLGTYTARAPIVHGGKPIGELLVIRDLSELRMALANSFLASLTIGAVAALIGALIAFMLQSAILKPINALTRTMDQVRATKDYSRAAAKTSSDETGRMVDAFNEMLGEIRSRDAALQKQRDELEETVADRTEHLDRALEAAEAANSAKSDFLAMMSHEIRSPMNGMLVMAELLANAATTPRLKRYGEIIVNSGHNLLAIINDVLDFSKIEAGKLTLEEIAVAPRRVVDDIAQLFSERAREKGLEIAAFVAPDVPLEIAADPCAFPRS